MKNNYDNYIKTYVKNSEKYKIEKHKQIVIKLIVLIMDLVFIYLLLKITDICSMNKIIEQLILIILSIVLFILMASLDKKKNYQNFFLKSKETTINLYHLYNFILISGIIFDNKSCHHISLLKSIFIFFLGFYFDNIFTNQRLNENGLINISIFSFAIILVIYLTIEIINLIFNNSKLKYECLLDEIMEYEINYQSKKLINKLISLFI
ncbi:MAG: hypothetical protein MRZ42_01500 [Tenericutes bacterium]|nr:hypothetical protein [Mycoplasmatota bacterium]